MTRTPNLLFKHTMALDYPEHRFRRRRIADKIDLWTRAADHVVGGCEWVDYMYYWDTLMVAHFSIDTHAVGLPPGCPAASSVLRVLHAPNHRNIKGTRFFIEAIDDLRKEGEPIELVLVEKVSNDKVLELIATADVIADQLIVGWYAMFALEAMAMGKPVLCYLREDLERFYVAAGLVTAGEVPVINCAPATVKETLRYFLHHRDELKVIGQRSRAFVVKHHSLEACGEVFASINRRVGLHNSQA